MAASRWPPVGMAASRECPTLHQIFVGVQEENQQVLRGHSSPVLVHCTNGAGRTGTYCLIDMAINRILKGVKELNIAGSLEYLRDQRMRMVENEEQYKFVFSCVAEEVSSLLKNLQH
uniref:Uncharacterized protein n=1 Tax=Ditylenchus dipsaci TaxID=166011 RepID=A0A915DRY3_9BILA